MPTKLTLRLDEELIQNAKKYAKKSGKSVSLIVANLFEFIRNEQTESENDKYPATNSLRGVLKDRAVSEQDYRDHLEKKHL